MTPLKSVIQMRLSSNIYLLMVCLLGILGCEKKGDELTVVHETGTVTDIEGNIYKTVKIGSQWWMAENLKVTTFSNGDPLVNAQQSSNWQGTTAPAYCIYDNNTNAPGLLYNWYAVNHPAKLAPEGWRIPSDEDWKALENYLGMNSEEAGKTGWRGNGQGEKLKIEGTQGWMSYKDIWPTNESGFSAEAGSCRLFNSTWGDPGLFSTGFWWCSNELSPEKAWYRHLDYKTSGVFRSSDYKNYGFSIRCIRN